MLIKLIIGDTLFFLIHILGSFTFFATAWLHFDSFSLNKKKKSFLLRGLGFLIMALSSIYLATQYSNGPVDFSVEILSIISLLMIISSLLSEGSLALPYKTAAFIAFPSLVFTRSVVNLQTTILTFLVSIVYFSKSKINLEKQIKPVSFAFLFLFGYQLLRYLILNVNESNVYFTKIMAEYSVLWYLSLLFYLIGIAILIFWAWGYLRFRLGPQIFITTLLTSLIVFIATSVLFVIFLVGNIKNNTLINLDRDLKIFRYSLESRQSETLTVTEAIARDSQIIELMKESDREKLYLQSLSYIQDKKLSFLNFVDKNGNVILRVQDKENYGDLLTGNSGVVSAIKGQKLSMISTQAGVINPTIRLESSVPIFDIKKDEIIGVVSAGFLIDNTFVDSVKEVTGLDVTVFAGDQRAATTLVFPNENSRYLGTKEANGNIISKVYDKGEIYLGENNILNTPFYVSYMPLITYNQEIIGMLSVGMPQSDLLDTSKTSIRYVFGATALLILFSLVPVYLLSKYIEKNIQA